MIDAKEVGQRIVEAWIRSTRSMANLAEIATEEIARAQNPPKTRGMVVAEKCIYYGDTCLRFVFDGTNVYASHANSASLAGVRSHFAALIDAEITREAERVLGETIERLGGQYNATEAMAIVKRLLSEIKGK